MKHALKKYAFNMEYNEPKRRSHYTHKMFLSTNILYLLKVCSRATYNSQELGTKPLRTKPLNTKPVTHR